MKTNRRNVSKTKTIKPQSSVNLTVLAFILVIFGSIALGIITVILSYQVGRRSLSTVTTPTENPTQKLVKGQNSGTTNQEFKIITEKDILIKVYNYVKKQKEDAKNQSSS